VALSHLFGFARIESDDIKEKKAAKHFEAKVAKLLKENAVVIADK
jgi:tRNA ligase